MSTLWAHFPIIGKTSTVNPTTTSATDGTVMTIVSSDYAAIWAGVQQSYFYEVAEGYAERENLLKWSEYLSEQDPIRASTAVMRLIEDTSLGTHYVRGTTSLVVGTEYTLSCRAKAGTRSWINLVAFSRYANFNLITGVVGNKDSSTVATIEDDGDGWYLVSMKFTAVNIQIPSFRLGVNNLASWDDSYQGDGSSYIELDKMQVSTTESAYIKTEDYKIEGRQPTPADVPAGWNHPMNGFKYKEVGGLAPAAIIAMDLGTHFYTNTDGESLTFYQETLEELGPELVENGLFTDDLNSWENELSHAQWVDGRCYSPNTTSFIKFKQDIVSDIQGGVADIDFNIEIVQGGVRCEFRDILDTHIDYIDPTTENITSSDSGRFSVRVNIPSNAVYINFSRRFTNAEFYLDNLSVREVNQVVNNNDQYFFGPPEKPELINYENPITEPCLGEAMVRVGAAEWVTVNGEIETVNGEKVWVRI